MQQKLIGLMTSPFLMIQLCGDCITLPLVQIFKSSLSQGGFPATWKMANIIPVYKKEEKYLVKNYRPISLLPISFVF